MKLYLVSSEEDINTDHMDILRFLLKVKNINSHIVIREYYIDGKEVKFGHHGEE